MKLERVTITGADNGVRPSDLADLSRQFAFVEWGILFSPRRQSAPRYPSRSWVDELCQVAAMTPSMQLAAHLCGAWVRDLVLDTEFTWKAANPAAFAACKRIQLNFRGNFHRKGPGFESVLLDECPREIGPLARPGKHFIFQCDGQHDDVPQELCPWLVGSAPLFDASGGTGVSPGSWPEPWHDPCGFAGGLGPENLMEQLNKIAQVAGDRQVWVDMETRVRSEDDLDFDLVKVRSVLEQARQWMKSTELV